MDPYTSTTSEWLDQRFLECDENGVYLAHQPIYGFRTGPTESSMTSRGMITYQVLRVLENIQFDSFVDIGGAEGYKAGLVKSLLRKEVYSCDLSAEACKRAKEIFDIDGEQIDIHDLPFEDGQFDVVLCSETLEHVADFKQATGELLRIAKSAVVITVPHESERKVKANIERGDPHGHIHSLNLSSFDFAKDYNCKVLSRKILSPLLLIPAAMIDARKRGSVRGIPELIVKIHDFCVPLLQRVLGKRSAALLISMDSFLAMIPGLYAGIVFVLIKEPDCWEEPEKRTIDPIDILNFAVPLHYPKKSKYQP